jgi:hypothetical protein
MKDTGKVAAYSEGKVGLDAVSTWVSCYSRRIYTNRDGTKDSEE